MSARRQARVRGASASAAAPSGVPAVLRIGACFEVWAPESRPPDHWADKPGEWAWVSSQSRFSLVRRWWLESVGVDFRSAEAKLLLPGRGAWCLAHLSYVGQAERVGRPVDELVDERFAAAGVSRADIPALRTEAQSL